MSRLLPLAAAPTAADRAPVFERIALVGFGLIGGSIALAVRQRFKRGLLIAIDNKPVVEHAMRLHAADVGGDDLVLAGDADLVVLAAPVRQNLELLRRLPDYIPDTTLVTDVGSTKRDIVQAAGGLAHRIRFVGGHPLAGAAASGLDAARPDLFAGRPWLLTPVPDAAADDVERIERFVRDLEAAPQRMNAAEHDRLLAYLSHLPQLAVSALMHVVGEQSGEAALALAGRGLRDTTRLASSPAHIWKEIAASNAEELAAALDALIAVLQQLRSDLPETGNLEQIFDSAARWKDRLEDGS
jgi:prephenate dehydrogenase